MAQGFKVPGKQPFELFRSPVHGLSNARKGLGCTDELGLVETPKGGPALFHQPARPDLIPLTAWVRACGTLHRHSAFYILPSLGGGSC